MAEAHSPPIRLSIITPSLNQGTYLERALRSVLDQGYPELEYMVFDGGSTDGSVEILERYSDRLAYWVSEPDRGQAHALNKGIARATGDVIGFINSDDYYLPGAFTTALAPFERRSLLWVAGACRFHYAHGALEKIWQPKRPEGRPHHWVLDRWSVPQASSFWRREVFERFDGFREDMHYVFDTEFILRVALGGVLPEILDDELAVRFLHEDAKSANLEHFEREARRLRRLHTPLLTTSERLSLGALHWVKRLARVLRIVLNRFGFTPAPASRR